MRTEEDMKATTYGYLRAAVLSGARAVATVEPPTHPADSGSAPRGVVPASTDAHGVVSPMDQLVGGGGCA